MRSPLLFFLLLILALATPSLTLATEQSSGGENSFSNDASFHSPTLNDYNIASKPLSSLVNASSETEVLEEYELDDTETFWVQDIGKAGNGVDDDGDGVDYADGDWDEAMYEISATNLAQTENIYVFVESGLVTSYRSSGLATDLATAFEEDIYDQVVPTLGKPSDNDQNNRTIVLVFQFREDTSSGLYTTGYFWSLHQQKPTEDEDSLYYYSEYAEIIHVNHRVLTQGIGLAAPTLAHEFFHLVHYSSDPEEDIWLEEGMAVFTEFFCGYHGANYLDYVENRAKSGFLQQTKETSLTYWETSLANYGASFLFILYLHDRFGVDLVKDLATSASVGIASVQEVLQPWNTTLEEVFREWTVTNLVNSPSSPMLHYKNLTSYVPSEAAEELPTTTSFLPNQSIQYYGSRYYQLPTTDQTMEVVLLPEIPNPDSYYQLTLVSHNHDTNQWELTAADLVNNQSGALVVPPNTTYDTHYLVVNSLLGSSSGWEVRDRISSTSTFHLVVQPVVLHATPLLDLTSQTATFHLQSLDGVTLGGLVVQEARYELIEWRTGVTLANGTLQYDELSQRYIVPVDVLSNRSGQYYIRAEFTTATGQHHTSYSPTFLLGYVKTSESTSNEGLFGLGLGPDLTTGLGLVLALALAGVVARRSGRKERKAN